MIKFVCYRCGQKVGAPDASAGRPTRCPKCKAINRVPSVTVQGPTDEPVGQQVQGDEAALATAAVPFFDPPSPFGSLLGAGRGTAAAGPRPGWTAARVCMVAVAGFVLVGGAVAIYASILNSEKSGHKKTALAGQSGSGTAMAANSRSSGSYDNSQSDRPPSAAGAPDFFGVNRSGQKADQQSDSPKTDTAKTEPLHQPGFFDAVGGGPKTQPDTLAMAPSPPVTTRPDNASDAPPVADAGDSKPLPPVLGEDTPPVASKDTPKPSAPASGSGDTPVAKPAGGDTGNPAVGKPKQPGGNWGWGKGKGKGKGKGG